MENHMLEIKVFGRTQVKYGDKIIGVENSTGKSKKMWELFEYLVVNHGRSISRKELIEVLWPCEEVSNPSNSLKVLVFKLRRELDRLEYIEGKEIIVSTYGTYSFNNSIPNRIDVIEFEKKIRESQREEISKDEKLERQIEAMECFDSVSLPYASKNPWAVSFQNRYGELYKNLVKGICEVLMAEGKYKCVTEICKKALIVQPYEENNYYFMVRAYVALENYRAASVMYDQIKNILRVEYGTTPSKKFELAYREFIKKCPENKLSIEELTRELDEEINFYTSFSVEYGAFCQIYRYLARNLDRLTTNAYISIYSLELKEGEVASPEETARCINVLEDALAFTLRQGDVFTRATSYQYAVIFMNVTEQNEAGIIKRIEKYFKKYCEDGKYTLTCKSAQIEPSAFEKRNSKK